jgi:SH3-like domain-containing protein
MIFGRLVAVCVLLVPMVALAQSAGTSGVLQLPTPGSHAAPAGPPAAPPRAAPVTAVQSAAPMYQPMPSPKPAKPPPLLRPQGDVHAQRPAGKPAAPSAAAAKPPPSPAPPAAPAKVAAPAPPRPPADIGTITGLKLPRWVSLRTDEVNLRVGPGVRFPVEWQYHRRDLPVQILREVEVWRLIEDQEGVKGWVHQATLVGHRSFVVTGTVEVLMRQAPDPAAAPVARLQPGVVGRLRACDAASAWCEVQVADYRGFLQRRDLWGTFPGEAVSN